MNTLLPVDNIRGHSFYTGLLNRDSIVVDLGAHKGEFSFEISNRFGCKCFAVEPLPSLYHQIPESQSVRRFNYAMAACDESVKLYVSRNPEGNSIASQTAGEDFVVVDGVTLETLMEISGIHTVDLLKMDVEGAEVGIFDSISDEVLAGISQITVEFHDFLPGVVSPHQVRLIKDRLRRLGFYAIKFSRTLNTDVLFINKHKSRISTLEYWYIKYAVKYQRGISRVFQRLRTERISP